MINKRDGSSSTGRRDLCSTSRTRLPIVPLRAHSRAKSRASLWSCWRHRNPFWIYGFVTDRERGFPTPRASTTPSVLDSTLPRWFLSGFVSAFDHSSEDSWLIGWCWLIWAPWFRRMEVVENRAYNWFLLFRLNIGLANWIGKLIVVEYMLMFKKIQFKKF